MSSQPRRPLPLPACIIGGGETTVTLPGDPGVGGRNQAMALSAALQLRGLRGVAFLAGATDGGDGPGNDAAGAVVTGGDAKAAEDAGLDAHTHLERCDAYSFFERYEEAKYQRCNVLHLRDGPTGTNVADVTILLVDSPSGVAGRRSGLGRWFARLAGSVCAFGPCAAR
mmetsp:Transcript_176853/g.561494  ORF Transcript_176853/g.561494 Transcript_176853/m.561494 type:complete len:169 (+) Transcript_176853:34-540(+)